jgi:hypothetical protein
MRNPTVKQVNYVINKLESVREQANEEDAFNMDEARVYDKEEEDKYECGTVHCVGGWYAVASLRRKMIKDKIKNGYVSFKDGVELMAKDLGFNYPCDFAVWLEDNPEIWGNKNGYEAFDNKRAYDNPGYDGVIAQWELVKQNLIELEQ